MCRILGKIGHVLRLFAHFLIKCKRSLKLTGYNWWHGASSSSRPVTSARLCYCSSLLPTRRRLLVPCTACPSCHKRLSYPLATNPPHHPQKHGTSVQSSCYKARQQQATLNPGGLKLDSCGSRRFKTNSKFFYSSRDSSWGLPYMETEEWRQLSPWPSF